MATTSKKKAKAKPREAKPRKRPDLFRPVSESKVSRVLRWMLEQGEVTAKAFKVAHVALGGTTLSTHAFDRYFVGKKGGMYSSYVPFDGSHDVLQRIVEPGQRSNARNGKVRWVGSEGATFEDRARRWIATLLPAEIDAAVRALEAEILADDFADESARDRALTWFRIASGAVVDAFVRESGAVAVRLTPDGASVRSDAPQASDRRATSGAL